MDDLLTNAYDEVEAEKIKSKVSALLAKGGFKLAKWVSNYKELMPQDWLTELVLEETPSV